MTTRARGWLITGAGGILGRDLVARLGSRGDEPVTGLGRRELDITEPASLRAAFAAHRPAVVVNCAAWTAVDEAEAREADALRVNGEGTRRLAEACRANGAVLLQVSTDYVFAGTARTPYDEYAPTGPRSAYGRTKLAGERAVLEVLPDTGYVVRTAWLYGAGGRNFVRTIIKLEGVRETVDVVDDQRSQPTWTADFADLLVRLGRAAAEGTAEPGIYHGTSSGDTTWFGLTREIFTLLGADPGRVRPTPGAAFARPAPRPAYSVLGHERWHTAGIEPLRHWRAALAQALPTLGR
ncbi:dTDP-4-dehydrorhamnose reductase [Streptomyces agglomeratus]|uniref:dTDP-4-dehydrorhamnose reductase n=1 Tax=Streptomyces agglomeratus TaxID=285458 RepID=A0A1E5PBH3_9ACTN|nr:dTDP-4-dehydrorhamnose reductase [Streptomyces agglomeratus]OEJ26911.1 dTDP-4-dehydrorhamnose reductase [Streptomyces agglomeratus]OEJ39042.1 dTDP-4-dehydrorhamnose reductase [Streptomyces agglomeratus]OEJ46577.1 dTDP-4-dehydrorhamnose reductase [Streptomyces agglomeratus]OEJ51566.1 dTDP-4-dehydrorhamnose reductase [Streptomyces agglomeratus]OEJ58968.1 dTDP-4-dehydrorhamnose reductase [Streptomyces agglomeratus]